MEIPPTDLIPILQKDSNVVLQVIDKTGTQAIIRPNHPFPAVQQRESTAGAALPRRRPEGHARRDGRAARPGNSVLGGVRLQYPACDHSRCRRLGQGDRKANLEKAKQLLKESGYDGRPIVMLDPTEQALIHKGVLVVAEGLPRNRGQG
jgi:peptide/nickel transport system substrate-binding protein